MRSTGLADREGDRIVVTDRRGRSVTGGSSARSRPTTASSSGDAGADALPAAASSPCRRCGQPLPRGLGRPPGHRTQLPRGRGRRSRTAPCRRGWSRGHGGQPPETPGRSWCTARAALGRAAALADHRHALGMTHWWSPTATTPGRRAHRTASSTTTAPRSGATSRPPCSTHSTRVRPTSCSSATAWVAPSPPHSWRTAHWPTTCRQSCSTPRCSTSRRRSTTEPTSAACPSSGCRSPTPLTWSALQISRLRFGSDWYDADYLDDTGWVTAPTLVFQGTDDDTVPSTTSDQLATAEPELVTLVVTEGAGHVESWNVDPSAYDAALQRRSSTDRCPRLTGRGRRSSYAEVSMMTSRVSVISRIE